MIYLKLYQIKTGIMNKEMYHSILVHQAIPAGKRLIGRGFVLMQDNDPKHTAIMNKEYLKRKEYAGK